MQDGERSEVMARNIRGQIKQVREHVTKQIAAFSSSGGLFAKGLASEGYNGGYRDALDDVLLALNGYRPNRNGWWEPKSVSQANTGEDGCQEVH
jgi:hypothetical protein